MGRNILPMNNGENKKKKVFQFHYRYPMIGGPVPIGFCLDELVEIADGLFLGQLIYSTALHVSFHSSDMITSSSTTSYSHEPSYLVASGFFSGSAV